MTASAALPYLAGAYGAVFGIVLVYVAMMRAKLRRVEAEVGRLETELDRILAADPALAAAEAPEPPRVRAVAAERVPASPA